MDKTERLDMSLWERKLCPTRSSAQNLIRDGMVVVNGAPITKCGFKVRATDTILVTDPAPFVSRSGYKLEHAMQVFHVDVKDKIALDVGASTGGFTECLLRREAKRVYAVDVGTKQLHTSLLSNPRVISLEKSDIRKLSKLPEKADIAVIDVSFISLTKILYAVPPLLTTKDSPVLCLIKPQFESNGKFLNKNGVIKDKSSLQAVIKDFLLWCGSQNWRVSAFCPSPMKGGDGNTEYLTQLSFGKPPALSTEDILSEYF